MVPSLRIAAVREVRITKISVVSPPPQLKSSDAAVPVNQLTLPDVTPIRRDNSNTMPTEHYQIIPERVWNYRYLYM